MEREPDGLSSGKIVPVDASGNVESSKNDEKKTGAKRGLNYGELSRDNTKIVACLHPPHIEKGIKHYLKDCKEGPEEEKPDLLQAYLNGKNWS